MKRYIFYDFHKGEIIASVRTASEQNEIELWDMVGIFI